MQRDCNVAICFVLCTTTVIRDGLLVDEPDVKLHALTILMDTGLIAEESGSATSCTSFCSVDLSEDALFDFAWIRLAGILQTQIPHCKLNKNTAKSGGDVISNLSKAMAVRGSRPSKGQGRDRA